MDKNKRNALTVAILGLIALTFYILVFIQQS